MLPVTLTCMLHISLLIQTVPVKTQSCSCKSYKNITYTYIDSKSIPGYNYNRKFTKSKQNKGKQLFIQLCKNKQPPPPKKQTNKKKPQQKKRLFKKSSFILNRLTHTALMPHCVSQILFDSSLSRINCGVCKMLDTLSLHKIRSGGKGNKKRLGPVFVSIPLP